MDPVLRVLRDHLSAERSREHQLLDEMQRGGTPQPSLELLSFFRALPSELKRQLNAAARALRFGDSYTTQYAFVQEDDDYATSLSPDEFDAALVLIPT